MKKNRAEISQTRRFEQIVSVLHKYKAVSEMDPVKLRMILEDLGPTYVKLGQIMSSRTDLISADYAAELQKLRSSVSPMPYEQVEETLVQTFGKKPEELFSYFEKEPVGAASMAQVHRAVTRDGDSVVVKVQRTGIREQMETDIAMLKKAAGLLSLNKVISGIVDPKEVVEEFRQSVLQELDFTHEAQNAIRFRTQNEGFDCIYVPRIYEEFSRENILVMEDIEGMEIDNYPALNDAGYVRSEIAMKLGMNYADQIIHHGFFHADPHSGNLKIRDGQIVWLDFGMMGEISASETALLSQAVYAMGTKDHTKLTDVILTIGSAPADLDYPGFSNALQTFISQYMNASFEDMDMAKMLADGIEICQKYKVRLPQGITMLARSMVTMQGTVKDLDPQANVLEYAAAAASEQTSSDLSQMLTKLAQQLLASSQNLLEIPQTAKNVLQQLSRGQLKVNLKLADTDILLPEINRIANRLIVCLLIAALLVGSSIVCTTELRPQAAGIPLLGLAGFFLSFCLSLWLFWKMIVRPGKSDRLF